MTAENRTDKTLGEYLDNQGVVYGPYPVVMLKDTWYWRLYRGSRRWLRKLFCR